MKIKLSLITCLIPLLLVFEAAGSNTYCSTCLLEDLNKNPQKIKVHSAVVFDKNGEPICRANLLEHSDLMPNFAQPTIDKTTYQAMQLQEKQDSELQNENNLLPCTDKYLNRLEKIATNNIVINNGTSPIHKIGWKYIEPIAVGVGICAIGFGLSMGVDVDPETGMMTSYSAELLSLLAMLSENSNITIAENQFKGLLPEAKQKLVKKINRWKKNRITAAAMAIGSACYFGPQTGVVVYESYKDDIELLFENKVIEAYEHLDNYRRNKRQQ